MGRGRGAATWRIPNPCKGPGEGAVVVGGLTVSTIFTIILVPVVLSVVFSVRGTEPSPDHEEAVADPA